MVRVIGVLRAGGDNRFVLCADCRCHRHVGLWHPGLCLGHFLVGLALPGHLRVNVL